MPRDTLPPLSPLTERRRCQDLRAAEDQLRAENENLRESVLELERVGDTYFELYELAAVGLCALDE